MVGVLCVCLGVDIDIDIKDTCAPSHVLVPELQLCINYTVYKLLQKSSYGKIAIMMRYPQRAVPPFNSGA